MGSLSDALRKARQETAEAGSEPRAESGSSSPPPDAASAPVEDATPVDGAAVSHDPVGDTTPPVAARPSPTIDPQPESAGEPTNACAASSASASEQLVDMLNELEARLSGTTPAPAVPPSSTPRQPPPPTRPTAPPKQQAEPTPAPHARPPTPSDPVPSGQPDSGIPDAESLILTPTYRGPAPDMRPRSESDSSEADRADRSSSATPPRSRPVDPEAEHAAVDFVPDHQLAEQYRAIRRRLLARLPRARSHVVAVVGTEHVVDQGGDSFQAVKSTATLSLGSVMAEIKGTTAVIVDTDFETHAISQVLELDEGLVGLADWLDGRADLDEVVHAALVGHGDVILAGCCDGASPRDWVGSEAAPALFEGLSRRYDFVLINMGVAPAASDLERFRELVTGVLMVTTTDQANCQEARTLVRRFQEFGIPVFGCILAAPEADMGEEAA